MLALSLDIFHSVYIIFRYYNEFPHLTGITYAFPFLYGPIFYLYAKIISTDNGTFNLKYYLHFIPFVLVLIYGFIFVYLESSTFKYELIRNETVKPPGLELIDYLKPVHGIIYTFLTIQVVRIFNSRIRNTYSNIEQINLNWLRHLTIGLSIIWGIVVISYIADALSAKDIGMDHLIYLAASVLIYTIGYMSLKQPQILDRRQNPEPGVQILKNKTADNTSYQKSGLTGSEAEKNLSILLELMGTDKPYLNSELTLRDLADKLSVSTHNLSEILNTKLNRNFYDFINHYRVEEVKLRMASEEYKNYSLIAIAFDSGFNSKSAFNTVFKKHTNLTPSQYRKQLR